MRERTRCMRCHQKQTVTKNIGVAILRSQSMLLVAVMTLAGISPAAAQWEPPADEFESAESLESASEQQELPWDAELPVDGEDPLAETIDSQVSPVADVEPLDDEPTPKAMSKPAPEEVTPPAAIA